MYMPDSNYTMTKHAHIMSVLSNNAYITKEANLFRTLATNLRTAAPKVSDGIHDISTVAGDVLSDVAGAATDKVRNVGRYVTDNVIPSVGKYTGGAIHKGMDFTARGLDRAATEFADLGRVADDIVDVTKSTGRRALDWMRTPAGRTATTAGLGAAGGIGAASFLNSDYNKY